MWSDASSYSYNPGWVSNQPTTNTAQVMMMMMILMIMMLMLRMMMMILMIKMFSLMISDDDDVLCETHFSCLHSESIFRTVL